MPAGRAPMAAANAPGRTGRSGTGRTGSGFRAMRRGAMAPSRVSRIAAVRASGLLGELRRDIVIEDRDRARVLELLGLPAPYSRTSRRPIRRATEPSRRRARSGAPRSGPRRSGRCIRQTTGRRRPRHAARRPRRRRRPRSRVRPAVSSSIGRSGATVSWPMRRSSASTRCQYQPTSPAPWMNARVAMPHFASGRWLLTVLMPDWGRTLSRCRRRRDM